MSAVSAFAVVAHRAEPTSSRLGSVLTPARALSRLRAGDVALARLDVLQSLDGIEPGLWAIDRLEATGVVVRNRRPALVASHDKLRTAQVLFSAGVPHPRTVHVAPWLPRPELEAPLVFKPRFGSWGRDVVRCDTDGEIGPALSWLGSRRWYAATGGIAQKLVAPRGYDLRILVAGGKVAGAIRRVAAAGEWRTNVELGARREPVSPPPDACSIALAAARAVGGDLVGIDLLPADVGTWVVLEVNGAVAFTGAYSIDGDVFETVRAALTADDQAPLPLAADTLSSVTPL